MSGLPTAVAAAVSVGIPLVFLYLVRRLDLYGSSARGAVKVCVGWGMIAFAVALGTNSLVKLALVLTYSFTANFVAPIVEELAKAVALVDQERRPGFTYFVDGAVLGFATGTGFAMVENLYFLADAGVGAGLGLSINRVFSASLMHGTACALVGVAIGRWRFGRGRSRVLALALGLAAAMALHLAYNNWVDPDRAVAGVTLLAGAIALGMGGLVVVALLILQGLREERSWLRTALALDVGVSPAESTAVQGLRRVKTLLAPVGERFGPARQAEVAELLRLQARLGLKRRAAQLAPDGPLRATLDDTVAQLRREVDARQQAIGLYVMAFVRAVWPDPGDSLWVGLDDAVAAMADGVDNAAGVDRGGSVWTMLASRADHPDEAREA